MRKVVLEHFGNRVPVQPPLSSNRLRKRRPESDKLAYDIQRFHWALSQRKPKTS